MPIIEYADISILMADAVKLRIGAGWNLVMALEATLATSVFNASEAVTGKLRGSRPSRGRPLRRFPPIADIQGRASASLSIWSRVSL